MASVTEVLSVYLLVTIKAIRGRSRRKSEENEGKKLHRLLADTLGVQNQKTVLTAIQLVIILGICPILV